MLRVAHRATAQVVAAASDTQHPQGVVALAQWPQIEPGVPGLVLVLDAIQDPGNLGTLLRTCDAVGACLAVPKYPWVPTALERGNTMRHRSCVHWVRDPLRWLAEQKAAGTRIVGVEPSLAADAQVARAVDAHFHVTLDLANPHIA